VKRVLLRPMQDRTQRIILTAMELAERDGYDAVRLRDVAEQAGVALGTVYRRFSCKEDILAAVLNFQVSAMRDAVRSESFTEETAQERLNVFFEQMIFFIEERPKMAAAMLRTVACGVPDLAERVTRFHSDMQDMILVVMRGGEGGSSGLSEADEATVASLLQNVFFAALVGWTGGIHECSHVVSQLREAIALLFIGVHHR
jgi:TetR/AcrR family transcriptional regulator, cholesterol catabolism regulator